MIRKFLDRATLWVFSVMGRPALPPPPKPEPLRAPAQITVWDAASAEASVRMNISLPKGAQVTATNYAGGPAILITIDGVTEAFVDRTYAAAAEEAEHWLETREEKVPVREGNRQERRRAARIMRKGKAN